jgi:hypothetical protein
MCVVWTESSSSGVVLDEFVDSFHGGMNIIGPVVNAFVGYVASNVVVERLDLLCCEGACAKQRQLSDMLQDSV